jgi:hypothetical protein
MIQDEQMFTLFGSEKLPLCCVYTVIAFTDPEYTVVRVALLKEKKMVMCERGFTEQR